MSRDEEPARRHSRREFVVTVGSIAATAGLPAAAIAEGSTQEAAPRPTEVEAAPPSPDAGPRTHDDVADAPDAATLAFLGAVAPGTTLGRFTVAAVHAPFRGAVPLVLEGEGQQFQLDVLATGSGPAPVAEGAGLSIYASAQGPIDPREVGRAAQEALRLLSPESPGAASLGLLTFDARADQHPYAVYSVLRD